VVICLEGSANDLHIVQLMPLPTIISFFIEIQNGSAFLVWAYPGCPGKRPLNWCSSKCSAVTILKVDFKVTALARIETEWTILHNQNPLYRN